MNSFSKSLSIDVRRLRVLRELRARGTIGATANILNLTPSAVSQQITALSRDLGVPLLIPHGRRVRLSPQALILLDHAVVIDAELERARADLAAFDAGTVGQVAVGGFATAIAAIVAPAILDLRTALPHLHLSVLELEPPASFSRLEAGELDVVISVDYRKGPARDNPRYSRRDLTKDLLVAVLPRHHRLASRDALDLKELAGEAWIVGAANGPCHEAGMAACASSGFSPRIEHYVNEWSALFALVAARSGVALAPRMAVPDRLPPGVVVRPLKGPLQPGRHIYAAIRAGSENHPGLNAVLDALQRAAGRKRS